MSSPSESDEVPNWAELAPNLREQEEAATAVARQVRIMFAAGKSLPDVRGWLQQIGLSAADADAFLAALDAAEQEASRGKLDLTSGPYDFGGVYAPREDPLEKRRERKAHREKSKRLAQTEPDPAFDLGGDSYARVLAREAQRPEARARLKRFLVIVSALAAIVAIFIVILILFAGK
jgi:hypothetical protein